MTSEEFSKSVEESGGSVEESGGSTAEPGGSTAERGATAEPGGATDEAGEDGKDHGAQEGGPRDDRGRLNLTDPKAMRALAHPVRWALLEALGHAGTLTATQASEILGESPANCAFHLRTLAKYGFVEEAGGGRGRERPWRQVYGGMSWRTRQEDPQFSHAAQALDQVWMDRLMSRAQRSLTSLPSWPDAFDDGLGATTSRVYVTPEEAEEIYAEMTKTFERLVGEHHRFTGRRDPKLRPPGAVPVEFVLLGYPILDAPPLPDEDGDDGNEASAGSGRANPNEPPAPH